MTIRIVTVAIVITSRAQKLSENLQNICWTILE